MALNLYELFHETARRQPGRPALLGPGADALTYAALDDAIQRAACRLRAAGVSPGDCVGLLVPSGADYIVGTYAAWSCGACVVPIPVELKPNEKEDIFRAIAIDWVIARPPGDVFLASMRQAPRIELSPSMNLSAVARQREHPPGFHGVNAAFIRFTSGTTGDAKGVVLSHETIQARIQAANDVLHIGPDDRVVWLLSMSYHFAVSIVAYLSFGAGVILPANTLAPTVLSAAADHRGTLIYASPMHYQWLAHCERATPLDGMRLAISTTTGLDRDNALTFQRRFGLPLTQALGIIEIGLPCINVDFAAAHPEAVGRVLPAYGLRMEDAGLGPDLRATAFSGPGFLDAYYHPWQSRGEIMPDGWFRTGDVGRLDDAGCLFLRGRTKDVISVMGMKFFPQEVETVLLEHPWVESASVFAEPDARLGEVPCARVVVKANARRARSADTLREYCRTRLAEYKVPERIEFVDALPRTASGKVLHRGVSSANASANASAEKHERIGAEALGRHA
jgi:long-chain acyl-CoA synthetase